MGDARHFVALDGWIDKMRLEQISDKMNIRE